MNVPKVEMNNVPYSLIFFLEPLNCMVPWYDERFPGVVELEDPRLKNFRWAVSGGLATLAASAQACLICELRIDLPAHFEKDGNLFCPSFF